MLIQYILSYTFCWLFYSFDNTCTCIFRDILELGSGLGMLGLAVCKKCAIQRYTFTDCHNHVLNLLASNIHINAKKDSESEEAVQTQCVKRARRSYEEDVHSDTVDCGIKPSHVESDDSLFTHATGSCDSLTSTNCVKCESATSNSVSKNDSISEEVYLDIDTWKQTSDHLYQYRHDNKLQLCKLDWEHVADNVVSQLGNTDVILAAGKVCLRLVSIKVIPLTSIQQLPVLRIHCKVVVHLITRSGCLLPNSIQTFVPYGNDFVKNVLLVLLCVYYLLVYLVP